MRGIIGNNNSDLTEMNRSAVVKILQQKKVCSRAEIARQTGLTQAAITKIVSVLMNMGIVGEVGIISKNNRRSIGLKLNADKHKIIGVKFARGLFSVGVFDISGRMYTITETKYSLKDQPKNVLDAIKKDIHTKLDEHKNVVSIGIAIPGPYLRDEGRTAVVTQLTSWHNTNFLDEFTEEEFKIPIFIEHDANAGALAEWLFGGHPQPIHTLAYFLVGDGVGSGIIQRDCLMLGSQGAACEIGHISVDVHGARCECGNYGCLESYCSAPAILKKVQENLPQLLTKVPTKDDLQSHDACKAVFESARSGNVKAQKIVKDIAEYIGYGCVTLINAYNPNIIVIGDIVSQGGDLILPVIWDVVRQRTIPELYTKVKIQITELKIDPTLYGAAATATDKVLQLPTMFSANR